MKLNKLWALLKKHKNISVMQGDSNQWIGDGCSAYPIYNLPDLNERVVQTLLDVKDDAWDNFMFKGNETVSFTEEDIIEEQFDLTPLSVELNYHGMNLMPLVGDERIFFIQTKYLKPFENTLLLSYYYREEAGGIIAVNEGLVLSAIIMPVNMSVDKEFEKTLYKLYDLTKREGGDAT